LKCYLFIYKIIKFLFLDIFNIGSQKEFLYNIPTENSIYFNIESAFKHSEFNTSFCNSGIDEACSINKNLKSQNIFKNLLKDKYSLSDNKKIFIIENNRIIKNSIKKLIEIIVDSKGKSDSLDIYTGSDGIDLIKFFFPKNKIIDTQKIACVIIDENMEYLNGSETIKILRYVEKKLKLCHINVVSLNINENLNVNNFQENYCVDHFINKPITKIQIENVLKLCNII